MTPEQEYCHLFERMYDLCKEQEWGDPGSYARSREIYMAIKFGHQVATTYSGADAFDGDIPLEYKSTIGKKLTATYNASFGSLKSLLMSKQIILISELSLNM